MAALTLDERDKEPVAGHLDDVLREQLVALLHQTVQLDETPVLVKDCQILHGHIENAPRHRQPVLQQKVAAIELPVARGHGKYQRHPRIRRKRLHLPHESGAAAPLDSPDHAVDFADERQVRLTEHSEILLFKMQKPPDRPLQHIFRQLVLLGVVSYVLLHGECPTMQIYQNRFPINNSGKDPI